MSSNASRRTMIDLGCGLGGVSSRFWRAGWRVISVDLQLWVRPTVCADIRALPFKRFDVDYLWASESCTQYSRLAQPGLYPNEPEPDLSVAFAIRDAIRFFGPRRWTVENVWGARRYYAPIFGRVMAMISGHAFWGSHFLIPDVEGHKHSVGQQVHERIRKLKRSIIPSEVIDVIIAQLELHPQDHCD